jgi:hypothetical protein
MPVAAVCVAVHTGWAFRPKRGDGHWGSRWARGKACRASTGPQKHGAERRSGRCAWRFAGDAQEFEFYGPQPLKQTQRQAKNSDIWEIHFETQGFYPRVFVLSGLPDVISSFTCQSRWHSGRAGWLAHINHGSLGEFEGASPCNLRPQAAKRPRERRSQRAALRSAPTHGGG